MEVLDTSIGLNRDGNRDADRKGRNQSIFIFRWYCSVSQAIQKASPENTSEKQFQQSVTIVNIKNNLIASPNTTNVHTEEEIMEENLVQNASKIPWNVTKAGKRSHTERFKILKKLKTPEDGKASMFMD